MSAPAVPDRSLGVALAAAAALLAALAVWPWLPRSVASPPAPSAAAPAGPGSSVARLAPLASFSATVERPLFSPSRRPVAAAKPALLSAAFAARYRLLGLVVDGSKRRALLAEGTRSFEIGEGDAIDGWTIKRIEQDRLILASPAGEAMLDLRQPQPAAPASGAAATAKPRR